MCKLKSKTPNKVLRSKQIKMSTGKGRKRRGGKEVRRTK